MSSEMATAIAVGIAFIGAVAIGVQTWLSYEITSTPPQTAGQRIFYRVIFVVCGVVGFASATWAAWGELKRDDTIRSIDVTTKKTATGVSELEGRMGSLYNTVTVQQAKVGDCLSQRELVRLLVLFHFREDWKRENPTSTRIWPDADYLNRRLKEVGANWTVTVSPDGSKLDISKEPEAARAID